MTSAASTILVDTRSIFRYKATLPSDPARPPPAFQWKRTCDVSLADRATLGESQQYLAVKVWVNFIGVSYEYSGGAIMVQRGCLVLLLGVILALSHGFQLRVPAVLPHMIPRAPGTRTVTSKPASSSSSTAEAPAVPAREGSGDDEGFDWQKHVSEQRTVIMCRVYKALCSAALAHTFTKIL